MSSRGTSSPRGSAVPTSRRHSRWRALSTAFFERGFLGFTVTQHIAASLPRIGYGFGFGVALAVPLGLASGWVRSVEEVTGPVVELMRPNPALAWIPFAVYFFADPFDAVFIVFLAAFFPVLLNTIAGVKAVDSILIDAARTLGARRLHLFTKVVLPAALGHIVTGMRIGLGIAWMSIVAAEMVGVKGGGLGIPQLLPFFRGEVRMLEVRHLVPRRAGRIHLHRRAQWLWQDDAAAPGRRFGAPDARGNLAGRLAIGRPWPRARLCFKSTLCSHGVVSGRASNSG